MIFEISLNYNYIIMKKLFYLVPMFIGVFFTSCYDDEIGSITNRLDLLEGTCIATLQEQIDAINQTLPHLEAVDKELDEYVKDLQLVSDNLQKQIDDINTKLITLESDFQEEVSINKNEILAELTSLKTELEVELEQIKTTIIALKEKNEELDARITELQSYVDYELTSMQDWVSATFATLEQFGVIAGEIATIKAQIEVINESVASLEIRLNEKIENDIAIAVAGFNATIQEKVRELTEAYTIAISLAKEDITAAYTTAIATAVLDLECSMKSWVNENLAKYYTIAEVDGILEAFRTTMSLADEAILTEIEALEKCLEEIKDTASDTYKKVVEEAISENNGMIEGKIASAVLEINIRIDEEIAAINTRIATIELRLNKLEDEIVNIKHDIDKLIKQIQSLTFVPEYSDCKATMYYTAEAGVITPDSAVLKYEVRPAVAAEELVKVWSEALSVKAVYAYTRASVGDIVSLEIKEVSAKDGVLAVVVSGESLCEEYFRKKISANVRLEVSNGYNSLTSDYVNMLPCTSATICRIEDENFKEYLIGEYDTNGDDEISIEEAISVRKIDISKSFVESLNGIEYFSNLETLDCSYNYITSLNLACNAKLRILKCDSIAVKELDISNNEELTTLACYDNYRLTTLICDDNFQEKKLFISADKQLKIVDIYGKKQPFHVGDLIKVGELFGVVFNCTTSLTKIVSLDQRTGQGPTDAGMWCENYGDEWYLPLIEEMKTIYNSKSSINQTLLALNYDIINDGEYWTSNLYYDKEGSVDGFYKISMLDGEVSVAGYYRTAQVRAALAF